MLEMGLLPRRVEWLVVAKVGQIQRIGRKVRLGLSAPLLAYPTPPKSPEKAHSAP